MTGALPSVGTCDSVMTERFTSASQWGTPYALVTLRMVTVTVSVDSPLPSSSSPTRSANPMAR